MKPKPNANKPALVGLRQLIDQHQLRNTDVAHLACVSVKTVESWLATPGSAMWRNFHPRHLQSIGYALPGFLKSRKTARK